MLKVFITRSLQYWNSKMGKYYKSNTHVYTSTVLDFGLKKPFPKNLSLDLPYPPRPIIPITNAMNRIQQIISVQLLQSKYKENCYQYLKKKSISNFKSKFHFQKEVSSIIFWYELKDMHMAFNVWLSSRSDHSTYR